MRRPARNLYGRRRGKRLRPSQRRLLDEALDSISIFGPKDSDNPDESEIDLHSLFGREAPVWLEVGFGSGEHLIHQAARHPDVDFLGCEPFVNGVASLLSKLNANPIPNIRIHMGDVRTVMDRLSAGSISRVFVLYPDPWPKRKHHRRRFVTPEFLLPLARATASGTAVRLATDIPDFARQAVEQISASEAFVWEPCSALDWQSPWNDWTATRYGQKARREGRSSLYLTFKRV